MKSITCKSFFKKVSAAQAEKSIELRDKVGQKRPDVSWSFVGFESETLATDLETVKSEHVAFFLNRAIETFGRDLLAQNGANWDYVPSPDSLSLAAAFEYYNAETERTRTLTKVTAANFANFYIKHAPALLGITPQAATAAATVICDWLKYTKDAKVSAAICARLEAFTEALLALDDESEIASDATEHLPVLESLLKAFTAKEEETISADAL